MAIYYSPYPTTQPPTALTQYVVGDWWVNLTLKYAYKLTISGAGFKSWVRTTTAPLPNINNIPAIVASTVTSSSSATIGQAISFNAITASGGATLATSYTTAGTVTGYNVTVSPALPAGLSVTKTLSVITGTDSNGNATLLNNIIVGISGTPTGPATLATSYTVTVTDASGLTASASFSLSVQSSGVAALTTTLAVPSSTITQGNTVNIVPVTAVGGTTPLTFSISPTLSGTGLSLNSSNGAITGTANTISSKTYVITVTDSSAVPQSNSRNYSLTINGIPLSSFLDTPTTVLTNKIAFTSFRPVRGSGGFGTLSYTINPALPAGLSFSSSNGFISGTATEASPQTEYSVTVRDSSNPQQTTTPLSFNLTVNELQPVTAIVAQSNLSLTINTPVATAPVQGGATIPIQGGGGFGTLTYSISPALGVSGLTFDTTTGLISGTPTATKTLTTYTVTVTDQATTPQTANAQFTLSVAAATLTTSVDISPVSLFKGVPTSLTSSIGYKPVSAKDGFGTYSYALTGNTLPTGLSFSNSTGIITGTANTLMVSPGNTFTVTVTDQTTPVNQTSSKDFVLIVSQPQALVLTNNESETRSLTRGVTTSFTPATASGGYGTYTYSISPTLPSALVFNTNNGTISGTPANSNTSITSYTVTVTDQASQTQNTSFDLVINTPIYFKLSTTPTQNVTKGVSIISFAPVLASGGDPSYTYSVTSGTLPAGLSLNSSTGYLSGIPTTVAANTFTITVTDQASQNLTQNCTVTVAEPAALTTTLNQTNTRSLVVNTTQTAFTPVSASGGYGTISFAITPALPSGLTFLSSNGYIFGTASALKGNSSYRVTASDIVSPPQTSFKDFFLEVTNAPLLASTTIASRSIVKNTIITSFTPVTASGGTPPYSYSASLPSGLTINSSTGAISGNASITQSSTSTTVNVSDVAGASTSNTFNLTITEPDALSVNVSTANATFGVAYSRRIVTPSGGFGNYTYSLTSGTLTGTGLSLNANTGFIAGTPTALKANNSYTIQVSDTSGQTANGTFNFSILPVALTSTVSSTSVSVQLYRAVTPFIPVRGNGGFGTLSYQITSGTLPAGLTFNTSTGQISGTPTATASASLTVTITDEALTPQTAVGTFTLNVASAAPPALQAVLAQSSYSFNVGEVVNFTPVTGSGGYPGGTYQYVLTGTLPSGLSFNTTTGNISGTFTEAFTSLSFTVTVNDEVPQYASKSFTLEGISPLVTAVDLTARNKSQLAYDHSNAAFLQANSAYASQNVTGTYANSAYAQANTAINNSAGASIYANAAFSAANTPSHVANSAALYANAAFLAANTPSHVANSAALYANAAFIQANAAYNLANTLSSGSIDQPARDTANSASLYANGAFIQANAAYGSQNTTGSYANSAYAQANTATNNAAGASLYANGAFIQANAAYELANTLSSGSVDPYARNTANGAFESANSAGSYANSAFTKANNALPTTGGTISGSLTVTQDVSITGNLVVLGNTTSINTSSFTVEDTLLTLGIGNYTSDLLDIGFSSHYNDGTNAHTGLIRDASEKQWMFFEGYTPEVSPNNNIVITDSSFRYANVRARDFTGNLIANTVFVNGTNLVTYVDSAFNKANNVLSGFRANTLIVANGTGHLSNSNAEFSLSNNTLYVPNANISNEVIANSLVFYDGTRLNSATGIAANTAATANVSIYAKITNVTTGTYFPIVTDTTITGSDTFHYSSNDFVMYAANNTFRATGNVWAGQFLTVGSNIPVVNSTGHWIGQQIVALANSAKITSANTGTYFPVLTDTTVNGNDSLNYASGGYLLYLANNTLRVQGNVWAGNTITVGSSNYPVVNSAGYWVGQPLLANTSERSNVSVYTTVGKSEDGIFYPVLVSTTSDDNLNFANSDFIFNASEASFLAAGNVYVGQNLYVSGTQLTTYSSIGSPLAHSYKFNGTNQYLEISNSSSILVPSTKDFTIEAFIYLTSNTTTECIASKGYGGTDWRLETNTSGQLFFYTSAGGNATSANSIPTNTWKHVAVSRTGGSIYLFIDGVLEASAVNSVNLSSTSNLRIGRQPSTSTGYLSGHISNFRFVNGTGLYSSNFTTPNSPLTSVANTVVLTAQSATIKDNGPYGFTLLNLGTGGVTANSIVSPFTSYEVFVDLTPTSNLVLRTGRSIQFGDGTTQNTSFAAAASYANSAFNQANTANNNAAGASLYANSAFAHANAAFNAANTAGGGSSYIYSGTSNVYFTSANGSIVANVGGNTIASVTNTGILMSGAEGDISGANNVYANTFIANTRIRVAGTGGDISGANNITANVLNIANGIVVAGVNVVTHLQSAFLAANTPSHVANSAALYANAAFTKANTDVTDINITSGTFGNSTHIPVVTISANGRINAISTVAATGGGSGSGNASFIFSGTSNVYFATANGNIVANVGGNTIASVTNTGIQMSGDEGDISGANNVYANTFVANSTIVISGSGGDISGASNITGNNIIAANGVTVAGLNVVPHLLSAFTAANTPSHVANSAALYANGSFIAANTADSKAVTAGSYANSAFSVANTDVTNINITGGVYGNSSSIPVITLAANGRIIAVSNATVSGGGGSGEDQFARDTANAAFIQANAAFNAANTGGGGGSGVDQYARDTANAAFNAANTTTSNNGTTLSGTITPLANTSDQFNIIGITGDITIAAPAGTPTEGQKLIIRLKDAGTGVNISWNVIYKAIGFTLPTVTNPNKTAYIGFIYNTADADWDGVAISLES
jgi:hypothetical protein